MPGSFRAVQARAMSDPGAAVAWDMADVLGPLFERLLVSLLVVKDGAEIILKITHFGVSECLGMNLTVGEQDGGGISRTLRSIRD